MKESWSAFYKIIDRLRTFDVNHGEQILFENTEITEFQDLNKAIGSMTNKIQEDFVNLKEYTENTSHEIQTPLAIINLKIESLLQSDNLTESQLKNIITIQESSNRLSKLNKTLIFLTKIDQRQFVQQETINIKELVNKQINYFDEFISYKKINIQKDCKKNILLQMNHELAETLILNLIKNAITHNIEGGKINIKIQNNTLIIENTGLIPSKPTSDFFNRFSKSDSNSNSLGIGLSIVKRICDISDIKIHYIYENELHSIVLFFK